jgi:hypothetical protein
MIERISSYRCLVPLALVVALSLALAAAPALGLEVSNAAMVGNVKAGETLTHTMTVSIGSDDAATDVSVYIAGLQQSPNGGYELLDASQDTSRYSARQFVTFDKAAFHLEPGGSEDITATVTVPQDVGDGGRYAMIHIVTTPVVTGGVGIAAAVDVPVYLTVNNSQLIHTGEITGVVSGEITSGQPINIWTDFWSTGNHHFKVKGEVTVTNGRGQTLDIITTPVTSSSILPGTVRKLEASLIPSGDLAVGTYTVGSKVMLEDGSLLDQSSTTFEVTAPYTAPAALVTLELSPISASTLQSQNGCISIHFPQGAAVVPVDVSLRDYPAEQLPSPPPEITLTSNCFRVDGVTGLLAKEATVTACYGVDDLAKADGHASRLRLAFWDEANSQWTVLKTEVDEGAMTLTASSNQGRIWAVVVDSAAGTKASRAIPGWAIPVGIVVGVVVISIAFFFLVGVVVERSGRKG